MSDDADSDYTAAAVDRHVPLLKLLEIRPSQVTAGKAVFEMTVDERHLRTLGILHGGVAATLLDTCMGYAAATVAPEDHHVVTVQLNVNFIRPAWESERLLATGEVRHSGRQTAVTSGEIRSTEGTLIASGTATFLFLPKPPPGEDIARQPD
jgi:acyl-CoA thioesterase